MNEQDLKVQEAVQLIDDYLKTIGDVLSQSNDKIDKDKATQLFFSWKLIINQCNVASDARELVYLLGKIQNTDDSFNN